MQSNHSVTDKINNKQYDFSFTGNGAEYFRIWIVNLLLTIITLGIYSAWAKVRTNRYFYGNTHLDRSSFEYLADPITILKGRLIAIALLGAYVATSQFYPGMEVIFILILFLFSPWLIVRSLAFNAQNSSYRNIRFNFIGTTNNAVREYIFYPMLIVFTAGLIIPYVRYRQTRFAVDNHLFGRQAFHFSATTGDYYKLFVIFFIMMLIMIVVLTVVMTLSSFGMITSLEADNSEAATNAMLAYIPLLYIAFSILGVYMQVKLLNLLYCNVSLGQDFHFSSNYKFGRMLWIHGSNLIAILLSAGLLYPWAKVRMARYRVEQLTLDSQTDLDSFTSLQSDATSATGDEIGEVFAIDVGL